MFYTYILKSKKDGKLYTGSTKNLRLQDSKDGPCYQVLAIIEKTEVIRKNYLQFNL